MITFSNQFDTASLQMNVNPFRRMNNLEIMSHTFLKTNSAGPGVDFTKGFKTWHKFSTEISFMLIPIIVLFTAHEFITSNF